MDVKLLKLKDWKRNLVHLYWDHPPDGLKIFDCAYRDSIQDCSIIVRYGKYDDGEIVHNCLVRELTGKFDELVDLMENELKFIYITREYPCFV